MVFLSLSLLGLPSYSGAKLSGDGGRPGPHLSFGKLSLEKAWERARFPFSFRCIRPPSPDRGSVASWLSVRSLGQCMVRVIGSQWEC